MSEKEYELLSKKTYYYALKISRNHSIAEEIAQNSLLKYLKKKDNVESPTAWLKEVVKNEYIKQWKQNMKTSNETFENFEENNSQVQLDESNDDSIELLYNKEKVREILGRSDYLFYKKMLKDRKNTELAKKTKMSLATVKKTKERIYRNLRTYYYLDDGYLHSRVILTFNQYSSIKKFLKQFQENYHCPEKMKSYFEFYKFENSEKINKIHDWGINYDNDRKFYNLYAHVEIKKSLAMLNINLIFDNRNRLKIKNIRCLKIASEIVGKPSKLKTLNFQKGLIIDSLDEIKKKIT